MSLTRPHLDERAWRLLLGAEAKVLGRGGIKMVAAAVAVHVVCDNLSTHKTMTVNDWLAKHPRFHMHFTPTGSSWLNQVERWFGFLTDQLLRRGVTKALRHYRPTSRSG